jgi:hypothetical protein
LFFHLPPIVNPAADGSPKTSSIPLCDASVLPKQLERFRFKYLHPTALVFGADLKECSPTHGCK